MKRVHPIFTLSSLGLTAILLSGLGLLLLTNGNILFSPGRLTALNRAEIALGGFDSHAAFVAQCSLCHAPLETTQDLLCLGCHTGVQEQIASGKGLHARIEQVNRCRDCHPDHRGEAYDPLLVARQNFDHSWTDFSLIRHPVNYELAALACLDCHQDAVGFAPAAELCQACHAAHDSAYFDQHNLDFGSNCLDCHDGLDTLVRFEHQQTSFPLEGQHASLRCADCHGFESPHYLAQDSQVRLTAAMFEETPAECAGCHQEPAAHLGIFDPDCAACHTSDGWLPATLAGEPFEHAASTGFSLIHHALDYTGQPLTCQGCHQGGFEEMNAQTCIDCHGSLVGEFDEARGAFMLDHLARYGEQCLACHDGIDRMRGFDHAAVFPLDGAHERLECAACHQEHNFAGTPSQCAQCHAEPQIHAGFFGLNCQNCHTTQAWTPAVLLSHSFPLDHGEDGVVACQTCHPATYIEYTCYGCHEHQPDEIREEHLDEGISLEELPACAQCHPNGEEQ
jgi:hypothetical protein